MRDYVITSGEKKTKCATQHPGILNIVSHSNMRQAQPV